MRILRMSRCRSRVLTAGHMCTGDIDRSPLIEAGICSIAADAHRKLRVSGRFTNTSGRFYYEFGCFRAISTIYERACTHRGHAAAFPRAARRHAVHASQKLIVLHRSQGLSRARGSGSADGDTHLPSSSTRYAPLQWRRPCRSSPAGRHMMGDDRIWPNKRAFRARSLTHAPHPSDPDARSPGTSRARLPSVSTAH